MAIEMVPPRFSAEAFNLNHGAHGAHGASGCSSDGSPDLASRTTVEPRPWVISRARPTVFFSAPVLLGIFVAVEGENHSINGVVTD